VPKLPLFVALAWLSGCASGYSNFYQAANGVTPEAIAQLRAGPPPKAPLVDHVPEANQELVMAYERHGYVLIGFSSFNSGHDEGASSAVAQGEKVGADIVVLIDPHYTGSISTSVPITTPTTQTAYTTGSATAYGSGGTVNAYGNSTTTTYGSETTYVPMVVQRYDYGALYFIKQRALALGIRARELNDSERQALQSNKGAYIILVVDGSPAFKADVLPGDIIVSVAGTAVFGQKSLTDSLNLNRGRTVDLGLVRNGQPLTKNVRLND
jgi:hypothetical protein